MEEKREKTIFGFWVYLMTDLLMFSVLFACFAVLRSNTFGGLSGSVLFDVPFVFVETVILLTSSFTVGLGVLAANSKKVKLTLSLFGVTFVLGLTFLGMEISEFSRLIESGNGPQRSGFLSSFFTLVGTHGLHISFGLLWMFILIVHIIRKGLREGDIRKLTLLSLFWHFLDLVWIFIFSFVYLVGVL